MGKDRQRQAAGDESPDEPAHKSANCGANEPAHKSADCGADEPAHKSADCGADSSACGSSGESSG